MLDREHHQQLTEAKKKIRVLEKSLQKIKSGWGEIDNMSSVMLDLFSANYGLIMVSVSATCSTDSSLRVVL